MKKIYLLFILMIGVESLMEAQIINTPYLSIGVKAGGTVTDMVYTQHAYSIYTHGLDYDYLAGVYVQYRPFYRVGLIGDLQYSGAGVKMNWADIHYTLHSKYIDFRLLAAYHYGKIRERWSPYLIAGPALGFTQSGLITYVSDYTPYFTTPLTAGDFALFEGGIYVGWGIDYTFYWGYRPAVVSFEFGFRSGLLSNYAGNDKSDDAIILNPEIDAPLYSKKRLNEGLEVALRLSIPVKERKKKLTSSRVYIPYVEEDVDEEIEVDTIPDSPSFSTQYEQKDCYSMSEIRQMVESGVDISGKRICFFDIYFDFDKDEVKIESYQILADLAAIMRKYPGMIIKVNGHTDSYGSDEYNQDLSERRARSVKHVIQGYGVNSDRIEWQGFGEKYPIETNETDEGRAFNRRVEIDILTIPKKLQKKTR